MILTPLTVAIPAQVERDADLNEYGTLGTKVRAEFGRAACEAGNPDHAASDLHTSAVDTIAHVLHWLDAQSEGDYPDPETALESALMHWRAER